MTLIKYCLIDNVSGDYVTKESYSKDLNDALLFSTEDKAIGTRRICNAEGYQQIKKITLEVTNVDNCY